jgi:hypothetical protein
LAAQKLPQMKLPLSIYWWCFRKYFASANDDIINGGSHSDAPIAFQEFMILP